MSSQTEHMKRKYRRMAPFYDLLEVAFACRPALDPRRVLASKIPDAGLAILDLCCGTGNGVLALSRSSNRIVGIDVSADMLAVARRKIRRRKIENLTIEEMDAARLRFADEHFDVVTTSFAMHEFEPAAMGEVLAEAQRVLKRGGTLYIVDYARPAGRVGQVVFSFYLHLAYPPHVRDFLSCDWPEVLRGASLKLQSIDPCFLSSVIAATRTTAVEGSRSASAQPA